MCNLARINRALVNNLLSKERVNSQIIDNLNTQVHRNTRATKQLMELIKSLCTLVQLLERKIHLNNQRIKALQDQLKVVGHVQGLISKEVCKIDNCLNYLVVESQQQQCILNVLVSNLPFVVASQVHCSIDLSAHNEPLPTHPGQYLHLMPEQETLVHELQCGKLNLLLLDQLETNTQFN